MYGLSKEFISKILTEYFGIAHPNKDKKNIYVGLGLTLEGATQNLYEFNEVSTDKDNTLNYKRSRIIFNEAIDGVMFNTNSIMFSTASEDWTTEKRKIQSVGIFQTKEFFNEKQELIQPAVILQLPSPIAVNAGETVVFDPQTVVLKLSDE